LWVCVLLAGAGRAQLAPEWLYHPPGSAHHLYSIGIAPKFLEDSLSLVLAKQHAFKNLAKQYSVTVNAKFAESGNGMGILSTGYIREIVDSAHVWQCRIAAQLVDSIQTDRYWYVLMRVRKDLNKPQGSIPAVPSTVVKPPSGKPPEWIRVLPEHEGKVYGIGISKPYTDLSDTWTASAREARREIAMTLSAKSATLAREMVTETGTYHRNWSEDVTRQTLQYSVIEERWWDRENNLYYTLISSDTTKNN